MSRWIINRYCFLNFWLFDDEKIETFGGNLLLNGENGSGKSVTLQSFIPVILDGNTHSNRLSTEGDTSRKIDYYLLYGDKEDVISYIYAEFKKENTYVTYGIGFKMKKNQGSPTKWYFKIEDKRVEGNFNLYNKSKEPYTLQDLKKVKDSIFEGKLTIFETQDEYKKDVNNVLFGFNTIEEYEETLRLILELRKPSVKDGNGFDPQFIFDILNNSLQVLSEERLKNMSDSFENIEKISEKIERMEKQNLSLENIEKIYESYNRFMLKKSLDSFVTSYKENKRAIEMLENLDRDIKNNEIVLEKEYQKKFNREEEKKNKENRLEELNGNLELKDIRANASRAQRDLEDALEREIQKKESLKILNDKIADVDKNIKKEKKSYFQTKEEILCEAKKMDKYIQEFFGYNDFDFLRYIEENKKIYLVPLEEKTLNFEKVIKDILKLEEELQKIKINIEQKNKELDERKLEIYSLERNKNTLLDEFNTQKESFIEELKDSIDSFEILYIGKNNIDTIEDEIFRVEDSVTFQSFNEIIEKEKNEKENFLRKESFEFGNKINIVKKEIEEKETELSKLINEKDISFFVEEKRLKEREKLIPMSYVELYKAVKFKEHLKETEKANIEGALVDLGILGDIISYNKTLEIFDKSLLGNKVYENSLFDLLDFEKNLLLKDEVEKVLKSISLNKNDENHISLDGHYSIGPIKGIVNPEYSAKYIGIEQRKILRQEKIDEIQIEIKQLQSGKEELEIKKDEVDEKIEVLKKEYSKLKGLGSIEKLKILENEIKNLYIKISYIKNGIKKVEIDRDELQNKHALKEKEKEKIVLINKLFIIDLEEIVLKISKFKDLTRYYKRVEETYIKSFETLQKLEEDIKYFYEINNLEQTELKKIMILVKENKEKIALYEAKLKDDKFISFENEIKELQREISFELPKKIEKIIEESSRRKVKIENDKIKLQEEKNKIDLIRENLQEAEKTLDFEINKNYLRVEEDLRSFESKESFREKLRRKISNEGKQSFSETDFYGELSGVFEREHIARRDFNLKLINVSYIEGQIGRYELQGVYGGVELSFDRIKIRNTESLNQSKETLTEDERRFFEDFLLNDLGREIKRRIADSKAWIKEIDDIMRLTPTSSGKIYKLDWSPVIVDQKLNLKGDNLEELLGDVKLKESTKVKEYFKNRIREKQENEKRNGTFKNNYEIIKEVLDYRKWFEFSLKVREPGTTTDLNLSKRKLNSYSGGEKVMAVYIPLFSALYARFNSASKDSLRILAMDEAFSVVDDENISNLFGILEQLDINYLLASQKLTGTYPTIKNLAIIHIENPVSKLLVEPKDGYITMLKYLWNGKEKNPDSRNVTMKLF